MSANAASGSVHFGIALLHDGWTCNVRIEHAGGRITRIDGAPEPRAGDDRATIGLPGMPNVHSHAFQRGMAGLTETRGPTADNFWSWRELMYRFAAHLTPDDIEALAAQAYVEMLEAGFTRVCEFHYVHHGPDGTGYANPAEMGERIAAAADATGIGLTLLPVFYAHGGFGGTAPASQQRRFVNDVSSYARLLESTRHALAALDDARLGIAPHSLRAVLPCELHQILPLLPEGPVHIHIAEQTREVAACEAVLGARPVHWLLDEMPVDRRWCLIHATHVNTEEVSRIAASGAVVGLCPVTEANLGDGIFPAVALQAQGGMYAVGSDSNVLISLSEELRTLEYGQRLRDGARNAMALSAETSTGRTLFESVLRGGLHASGSASGQDKSGPGASPIHSPGGLHVGAAADFVSLSDHVALAGRSGDALLDSMIFARSASLVDGVWRAGHKLVSGGRHRARARTEKRYRAALRRLLSA